MISTSGYDDRHYEPVYKLIWTNPVKHFTEFMSGKVGFSSYSLGLRSNKDILGAQAYIFRFKE